MLQRRGFIGQAPQADDAVTERGGRRLFPFRAWKVAGRWATRTARFVGASRAALTALRVRSAGGDENESRAVLCWSAQVPRFCGAQKLWDFCFAARVLSNPIRSVLARPRAMDLARCRRFLFGSLYPWWSGHNYTHLICPFSPKSLKLDI